MLLLKDCTPEHPYLLNSAVEMELKGNLIRTEIFSYVARAGMYPVVYPHSAPDGLKTSVKFCGSQERPVYLL